MQHFLSRARAVIRWMLTGDPIKSTWTSGGIVRNVTTYKLEGESSSAWSHRHIVALSAALASYPPDT